MKRILILMFCMILLVGSVSAMNWDNGLKYSNNDLKVSIENGYFFGIGEWFGLNEELGTAELRSHKSVDEIRQVIIGSSVLTWYDINFKEIYTEGLGEVIFINEDTGKEIQKDYSFVYWDNLTREIPVYDCSDVLFVNGTYGKECIETGKETIITNVKGWLPYNSRDIPNKEIRIGVKANIGMEETIDVIWTISGKKIKKHVVVTSGAVETTDGFYTIMTYLNNGTFNVTVGSLNVSVLIVAAGGGGGGNIGGGGGAGGLIFNNSYNVSGNLTVIVGIGGTGGLSIEGGFNGTNSSFGVLTALGGGGGGTDNAPVEIGSAGGSGGGSAALPSIIGGEGLVGQGNDGAGGLAASDNFGAGGGGGAGDTGVNGTANTGGNGGAGLTYSIYNGTPLYYAGGGGGGTYLGGTLGLGGLGGGGDAGVANMNATANTGGGGGGQKDNAGVVAGAGGSGIVIVRYLTSRLSITLLSPENNTNLSTSTNYFVSNVSEQEDVSIVNVSLRINGIINQTNTSGIEGIYNFSETLSDGDYNWTISAFGNESIQYNATNGTLFFSIDTTPPQINLTSPTGQIDSHSIGDSLFLNWTVSDLNLDACWYNYNSTNTTVTCNDNTTTFNTVSGEQFLTFYANDTFNNLNSSIISWTYAFLETGVDFNGNVSETSSQLFEINMTTDIVVQSISAIFNYNGTNYTSIASCSSGNCTISNTLDIPLVLSGEFILYDFFWTLSIFNGTDSSSITTSTREQNVTRIHLEECDGVYTNQSLNFTTYDEQNLTRIDPYKFDATFDQWLGSGNVKRQTNFSNSSLSEEPLCILPIDETYFIDAIIEYDEIGNGTTYTLRNYYFQNDTINNVSQEIFLYLLKSSSSTSFILKVQDDSLLPISNALIEINRFYPGTNEFRIVQIARTDDLGKSVGFFVTETVDYKFFITQNNVTLLETGLQKVIPESSPFTLTFNVGEPLGEPWSSQQDIGDLNSSLTWNNNTGIVTYSYIDTSDDFSQARLFVIKQSLTNSSADITICNETSLLTSATLTCSVGSTNGFYVASSFISRDSAESLDLQFTFQIETFSGVVGLLGLFFGWFLILIASFMFKFNEIAGIWGITIIVLFVNLIGLINFGGVFVTAIIAVAVILTWLMEK